VTEVVDHYEQIIRELESPADHIGYGLGGFVTQILLDSRRGAAGVAIRQCSGKGNCSAAVSMLKLRSQFLGKSLSNKAPR